MSDADTMNIRAKNGSIKLTCPVFADDLTLLTEWKEVKVAQIKEITK